MNPTTNPPNRRSGAPRPKRPAPGLRAEIIEIGAVKLNADYEQIDQFSCYVKPEMNTITKKVTEITGLTDADVAQGKPLAEALADFTAWIGDEPVRIYAWSESDKKQLVQECQFKGIWKDGWPPCLRRWMDFQKVYTRIMGLSRSLSLTNAIMMVDNDFEGHQHSALADSENSAALLRLVKNKEAFAAKTSGVRKVLSKKEEPLTSSLGDMFAQQLAALLQEDK